MNKDARSPTDASPAEPASAGSLARASGLIAGVTLLTKVTGFLRVARISERLGATAATDAFLTAFLIPESIYVFLTEGALAAAFVPPFTRSLTTGPGSYASLLWTASLVVGALAALLAVAFALLAPALVALVAPGFDAATASLTARLTVIVSAYIPMTAMATVLFAGLNARGHFFSPALGPLVFNLAVIASVSFATPSFVEALAWGVLAGGLAQLLVQLPPIRSGLPRGRPRIDLGHPGLGEALRLVLPLTLSIGITQVQMLAERYLASELPRGAITSLNLVQKLVNLPLGLVGIAIAAPLVPALTRLSAACDLAGFARALSRGLVMLTALIVPLSAVCLLEPVTVVRVLFQRGAYGPEQVADAARMLWFYAAGLPAVSASFLLTSAFLASGDALTPALTRAVLLTANVGLNFAWISRWGSATIPLTFSLMYLANLAALLFLCGKRVPAFSATGFVGRAAVVVAATAAVATLAAPALGAVLPPGPGRAADLAKLAALGGVAAATSLAAALAVRPRAVEA